MIISTVVGQIFGESQDMLINSLNNLRIEDWNFLNLIKGICRDAPHRPAYKSVAYPALRPRKQTGVRNRDINGLMDGGVYMSTARF